MHTQSPKYATTSTVSICSESNKRENKRRSTQMNQAIVSYGKFPKPNAFVTEKKKRPFPAMGVCVPSMPSLMSFTIPQP